VRPCLEKNPSQKMIGGVARGVGPEFKPHYQKKELSRSEVANFKWCVNPFCVFIIKCLTYKEVYLACDSSGG
jgi:hypothetical protein